jgi:protein disulfide-isomerase A6
MYGVSSYPTIKFFGKGRDNKENPTVYEGSRSEQGFVDFLNEKCGTHRAVGGGLNHLAGRVPSLDDLAQKFIDATSSARATIISEATILGDESKRYIRVMEKIVEKSSDYVTKELKRYAFYSLPS